jgi:phosphate/sulfate permease
VIWAAFFNFITFLLVGAIAWNVITWWFGIPSSSSHALIGGLAGLVGSGVFKTAAAIVAVAWWVGSRVL